MTTYTVTGTFPEGTTGTVTFQRKEWLTSNTEGVVPPQRVVATLVDEEISQVLRASEESGVAPDFTYWVYLDLDGYDQMVGRMYLTANSDLGEVFQWETPANPEIFATKAELEALTEALGDPVSEAEVEAIVSDAIDGVTLAYEAADTAIDARLDSEEAATAAHDTRLDNLEALGVPDPASGTDDDVLQVQGGAYVLAPEPGGGGGGGGGGITFTSKTDAANVPVLASGTPSAVEPTSLSLTFEMPAAGAVFVHLEAYARLEGGSALEWALYDELDAVAVDFQIVTTGDANPGMRVQQVFLFEGTPTTTYTLVWWQKSITGDAYTWYGPYGTGKVGPALMWWEPATAA